MRRVIVLRPEPGASETVRRAQALGLKASSVPLFQVEPVEWTAPDAGGFDALLLTSANAVRHGGAGLQELRGLPVYAVGEATADAARDAGFEIRSAGESGVERLLESIAPDLRLVHLCGEHRKASNSAAHGITAIPVYRAVECDVALDGIENTVALIHSPRAGRRLAELVGNRSSIAIAAISQAAAEAAGDGWRSVGAAERPTDAALLALAARLCNTSHAK